MSNETKRDVYDEIVNEYGFPNDEDYKQLMDRYDAALPDDLPVIPKGVSDLLVTQKQYHLPLSNVLGLVYELSVVCQQPGNPSLNWVANHEDTFARAWVLGVWRVEETGEIVKLEEEK